MGNLLREGLCNAIMMNHEEAAALCGNSENSDSPSAASQCCEDSSPRQRAKRCCAVVSQHCDLTVVTMGINGLWVSAARGAAPVHYDVTRCDDVVDSTGAGDFFAGG